MGEAESPRPRLYADLANWFHLLTPPEEYEEEAALYREVLTEAATIPVTTVLELGSGGGNNASHLKAHFDLTLVDVSEEMLAISRSLNPELEHHIGDMRTVRLNREFDAVFVHDAVDYMLSEQDLAAAIETAVIHCRIGGVVLFVPDHVRENFAPSTSHGGHDGPDRSMRYLEWDWDPDPEDTTYVVDFAYLLRDGDGVPSVEHDRHVCGIFPRATWLRLFEEAGLRAEMREDPSQESQGRELFVGVKG